MLLSRLSTRGVQPYPCPPFRWVRVPFAGIGLTQRDVRCLVDGRPIRLQTAHMGGEMVDGAPSEQRPRYDRDFLLSPAKRNQIVDLWEVEKFGRDSFGDPDAVTLYGMRPAEWYARGVRILARTTLEAVRDPLGNRIGRDVARVAATTPVGSRFGVVDP